MAKQKQKRDSKQKALANRPRNFSVGDQSMNDLVMVGSSLSSWKDDLENDFAASFLLVFILAQIRGYNIGVPSADLDALPSVKYYKSKVVNNTRMIGIVAILAVAATIDQLPSASPSDVEEAIISTMDSYRGNSKVLPNVNSNNVLPYRHGLMSRSLGWLQSCAISNMQTIGLDPRKICDYGIDDVLRIFGFGQKDKVIEAFKCLLPESRSLTFNEPKLMSESVFNGNTKLEHELLGDSILRTGENARAKTAVGFGGMIQPGSITSQILSECLSGLELAQYHAAIKNGNQAKYRELTELAASRREELRVTDPEKFAKLEQLAGPKPRSIADAIRAPKPRQSSTKAVILEAIKYYNESIASSINLMETNRDTLYGVYVRVSGNPEIQLEELRNGFPGLVVSSP